MKGKGSYRLMLGDCLGSLKSLADNSIDSLVTDPPYGLSKQPDIAEVMSHWLNGDSYKHKHKGFMGKSWDSFVPNPEYWREVYRVLKPGGHGLVFAGTRTVDLMTISLRFAGFEIRDQICWLYGSGFPKSANVSKAIDKAAGAERKVGKLKYKGGTQLGMINDDSWKPKDVYETKPATQAAKQWDGWGTALKPAHEPIILVRKPISEKNIAANVLKWSTGALNIDVSRIGGVQCEPKQESLCVDTAALKSPHVGAETSPRSVVKPAMGQVGSVESTTRSSGSILTDTSASNTGTTTPISTGICLNTDSSGSPQTDPCLTDTLSITETKSKTTTGSKTLNSCPAENTSDCTTVNQTSTQAAEAQQSTHDVGRSVPVTQGRFPSNLVLSHNADCDTTCTEGCAVAELDLQSGMSKSSGGKNRNKNKNGWPGLGSDNSQGNCGGLGDFGGASRYFYCAKASRRDKGEGNTHATVKPTKLMQYLIKLITPPGGVVLDPFAGSGSTGVSAIRQGFRFIGCEAEQEYLDIAERRIDAEVTRIVSDHAHIGVKNETSR